MYLEDLECRLDDNENHMKKIGLDISKGSPTVGEYVDAEKKVL